MSSGRPDILLVVCDSVRAQDFPVVDGPLSRMPFVDRLRAECVTYPWTVSPAAWTVPAHASLFSGKYPWEHGVHGRGSYTIEPAVPLVAEQLHSLRYRTASISANPHLNPRSGLARGFDFIAWGDWRESYLRYLTDPDPPHQASDGTSSELGTGGPSPGALGRRVRSVLRRLPWSPPLVWDAANRVAWGIRGSDGDYQGAVSPWVEPTLHRWLSRQDRHRPVFVFLNFLEGHEPFPVRGFDALDLASWIRAGLVPQDRIPWAAGRWRPTPRELSIVHGLYRRSVASLDGRLESVVRTFEEAGRWEHTLFVLTSDHGQAFGEHGTLYHEFRVDESLVRIPLWVRFPAQTHAGREAVGWTSLVDVAPAVLAAARGEVDADGRKNPFIDRIFAPRSDAVYAMSEGLLWNQWPRIPVERRQFLDRVEVASYRERWKVVVDPRVARPRAFDVVSDPRATRDVWESSRGLLEEDQTRVREIATSILHGRAREPESSVRARLDAWGYE